MAVARVSGFPARAAGQLLTAREVAQVIGVSTETILRWTRRGDLPAIRLPGGAIRFREDDLEQWLSHRATVPATFRITIPATPGGTS
jgi:excisionase family DNA binding protein